MRHSSDQYVPTSMCTRLLTVAISTYQLQCALACLLPANPTLIACIALPPPDTACTPPSGMRLVCRNQHQRTRWELLHRLSCHTATCTVSLANTQHTNHNHTHTHTHTTAQAHRSLLLTYVHPHAESQIPLSKKFFAGGLSGALASFICVPTDLMKVCHM